MCRVLNMESFKKNLSFSGKKQIHIYIHMAKIMLSGMHISV